MKLIIDTRGFSLLLPLVIISAILIATVFLTSSIKSVLDIAFAATNSEKNLTFEGIILKGAPNRCKSQTEYTFCYKLFPDNGDPAIWIKPSAGVSNQFESFIGKRVSIRANKLEYTLPKNMSPELLPTKDKDYYKVKSLSLNPFDFTVNYGIGGLGSGQGPADRADLGIHSMDPGIYWSAIQPEANTPIEQIRANLARYLDPTQIECQQKKMSCGIFISGVPKYAVNGGLAKYQNSSGKEMVCKDNNYPFPLDNKYVVPFATLVGEVAERYDGDGKNDAPGSPIASHIMLFNEVDWKNADSLNCGDPVFNSTKDLNDNGAADYIDYANLMEEAWRKVKNATAGKVSLATSRYATYTEASRKFIENVMAYQYSKYPTNPQVFFDIYAVNYYDNDKYQDPWVDSYSVKGTRGKINWIEGLMTKYGGVKPIIFSEIGFSADDPALETEQASRLFQVFAQAYSKVSVKEVNWFTLYSGKFWHCCALIYNSTKGEPTTPIRVLRPAYYAFKTMQKALGGAKFLALDLSDPQYIEGYIFIDPLTRQRKEVVWYSKRDTREIDKRVIFNVKRAKTIKLTKPDASVTEIKDGSPTDLNSSVNVVGFNLTPTPVIIEFTDLDDAGPI